MSIACLLQRTFSVLQEWPVPVQGRKKRLISAPGCVHPGSQCADARVNYSGDGIRLNGVLPPALDYQILTYSRVGGYVG